MQKEIKRRLLVFVHIYMNLKIVLKEAEAEMKNVVRTGKSLRE